MSIARGLVGWWRLDGRLVDESGNGNNGTVGAGSAAYAAGKFGQAWDNDETRYASIPNHTSFAFKPTSESEAESFTITFWVKGVGPVISYQEENEARQRGWIVEILPTGSVFCRLAMALGSSLHLSFNTVTSLSVDSWQHVAVVFVGEGNIESYKAENCKVFINGFISELSVTSDTINTLFFGSYPLQIGRSRATQDTLHGQIQNATIYNRALAAHEIRQLYALGSPIGIV